MLPSISAITSRMAPAAAGSAAASFCRTAAEARSTSLSRCWRGRSWRVPTCTASTSSPTERSTRVRNAALEKRAPLFCATERTTSRSPRSTSTSVTCFAQRVALRDREQMLLAVRRGGRHQVVVVEPRRMAQHRLRPRAIVVVVRRAMRITPTRRIGNAREPARELGARVRSRSSRRAARSRRRTA